MRETAYAREIATARDQHGQTIERLHIKDRSQDEIRFSWWKDGRMMMRPLDLSETDLLSLLQLAMDKDVFSDSFLLRLQAAIATHAQKLAK